jgi:hypothetical protein
VAEAPFSVGATRAGDGQGLGRHGVIVFGRVSPGELRVFNSGEFQPAVDWLAGKPTR